MPFEVQHEVDLPEGVLLAAKLNSLEAKTIPYNDRQTGEAKSFDRLNWLFEVTEQGDFSGKTVRAETSTKLSDSKTASQFGNFAAALLGRELVPGQVLDESDLVGLPCLITIQYVEDRQDKSKKWPRVAEVFPGDPATNQPPF